MMKRFYKKYKKSVFIITLIIFLVLVFIVPIFINWLYNQPASVPLFAMSWEAKDVLSFYGSLLGAVATIVALVFTIKFTSESQKDEREFIENNQKEERKLSVRPYFQTKCSVVNDLSDDIFKEDITYIQVHLTMVECSSNMPDDLRDLQTLSIIYDKNPSEYDKYKKEYFRNHLIMTYEMFNYGANNAIGVKIGEEGNFAIQEFCVSTIEPKKYIFIFDAALLSDEDPYNITFNISYTDIYSLGKYIQKECFKMGRLCGEELAIWQSGKDFLTAPKEY